MLHFHSSERCCRLAVRQQPKPCNLLQFVVLFLVHASMDHSCDSTEPLKQEFRAERTAKPERTVPHGSLHNTPVAHLFGSSSAHTRALVLQMTPVNCVSSFPNPTAGRGWGRLSFGGVCFTSVVTYFSEVKEKKKLCWYISPSNKPKIGLGLDLTIQFPLVMVTVSWDHLALGLLLLFLIYVHKMKPWV
jgi:hypothetical protein